MEEYLKKTDEELLCEYKKGENPYFLNIIFTRYSDVGYRTALRYMRNPSDAEDVLQMGFIQFLQNLHNFREGTETVKPWLMKMIVNASICKLREEKQRVHRQQKVASQRNNPFTQKQLMPETIQQSEDLKQKILSCVDTLPEKYRFPLSLVLYEGFSYPEAASVLDLPEKTVRTQVARGLERLRNLLGGIGTSLSITIIVQLIKESKLESAPHSVKAMIESDIIFQHSIKSLNSYPKINSTFYFYKKIIVSVIFTLLFCIGFYYSFTFLNRAPNELNINGKLFIFLDFNKPLEKLPFQQLGEFHYLKNGGFQNGGCIEIPHSLILKIPIKKEELPIKISFRWNVKTSTAANRGDPLLICWSDWDKLGRFSNLAKGVSYQDKIINEYLIDDDRDWPNEVIWVTEKSIDYWINDQRNDIDIFDRSSKKSDLIIRLPGNCKFENLKIETVSSSQTPINLDFISKHQTLYNENTPKEILLDSIPPKESSDKYKPIYKKAPSSANKQFEELIRYFNSPNFQ